MTELQKNSTRNIAKGVKKMARLSKEQRETKTRVGTRTDCFAYDKDKRNCKALNGLYCAVEQCGFYKPAKGSGANE